MSYIAFELDALNAAPAAARSAGVSEEVIISGLVRMWAWCFREKTDSDPSAAVWLSAFIAHCIKWGYSTEQLRAESRLVFMQVRAGLAVRGDSV